MLSAIKGLREVLGFSKAVAGRRALGLGIAGGALGLHGYNKEVYRRRMGDPDAAYHDLMPLGVAAGAALAFPGIFSKAYYAGKRLSGGYKTIGTLSVAAAGLGIGSLAGGINVPEDASTIVNSLAVGVVAGHMGWKIARYGPGLLRPLGFAGLGTAGAAGAAILSGSTAEDATMMMKAGAVLGGAAGLGYGAAKIVGKTGTDILIRGATFGRASYGSVRTSLTEWRQSRYLNRIYSTANDPIILHDIISRSPMIQRHIMSRAPHRAVIKPPRAGSYFLSGTILAHAAGTYAALNAEQFGIPEHMAPEYAAQNQLYGQEPVLPSNMGTGGLTLGIHSRRRRRHL